MSTERDKQQQTTLSCHSNFVDVNGHKIHYREQGQGRPIVFLHGMPVSGYLWRDIMPQLAQYGRCIAPDLIGMGESDKPDIEYRVFDHIDYINQFIEALDLTDVILVLHGWGSVIGFEYAHQHPTNVSAVAFFESHIRPTVEWEMLSLPVQQLSTMLIKPDASYIAVIEQNYFIRKLLPSGAVEPLAPGVIEEYEKPFLTEESRRPLWQYLLDLPLGNGPEDVVELIDNYSAWLQQSDIPKLMLYAVPGFITTIDTVQWAKDHLSNLTLVCLEDVLHFPQETAPELFAEQLSQWYVNSCIEHCA